MVVRVLTSNRKLTEEDVRYMRMIEELGNERLKRWLRENNNQLHEEHVKERNNSKAPQSPSTDQPYQVNPTYSKVIIRSKMSAFIPFKRPQSPSTNQPYPVNLTYSKVIISSEDESGMSTTIPFMKRPQSPSTDQPYPVNPTDSKVIIRSRDEGEMSATIPPSQEIEKDRKRKKMVEEIEMDGKRRKMVPQKSIHTPMVNNEVTERLKEFIVNVIKGTELRLVIQKKVFKSDTNKGLNRLNMPIKQLESNEFLREDERRILRKEKEIEVMVLGPTLEMYEKPMKLKMWHMTNSVNYVLTTNWHSFWKENKKVLDQDSKIQVWSFRRADEKLCFAVVRVGRYDKQVMN
ncbi:hypothetical protein QVD17_20917 [Tagetes erecta]|uniref:B3 domain-containing protein n=1 Tax=Tagetes erecta TaxID=13708 RepID=A0AAD8KMJ8_TARER|nr:hypothetical protein QVD17_20917 [Tagetes erecta]